MIRTRQDGFTLVELLIVIVVIGILAAISIIAYSGVSTRAQNAAVLQNVSEWSQVLQVYKTNNGTYPTLSNDPPTTCLGTDYPAANGFAANTCYIGSATVTLDTSFFTAVKTVSTVPGGSTPVVTLSNGDKVRGLMYGPNQSFNSVLIGWYFSGDQSCGIGSKIPMGNVTFCELELD